MDEQNSLVLKNKLGNIEYLFSYFLLYSFIGWLLETCYAFITLGYFTKRGFLFGPICPIYGWGAIILIVFLSKYKNNSFKLFFSSAIIFSLFEYLVGYGLDVLFAAKWWDYSNDFLNLNSRISIQYTLAWGFITLIFINLIHPFIKSKFDNVLDKAPKYIQNIQNIFIKLLFIVFVVDTILSIIGHLPV